MLLQIRDLNTYYGASHVLQGISVDLAQGELVALLGRNGMGKSTTLKTVMGLVKSRSGSVVFDGREITGHEPYRVARAGIGYVPEERRIFPELSVRHNIELGAVVAGRDVTDLPARIEAALDKFPVLRQKAAQQASTLSGGEQKQLEIARGLLLNPQLMLVDEPSIGLSPLLIRQTFGILQQLRDRGVSILLIEQNARSALEISDFGIVLELGQTRLVDKADRVLSNPRVGQLFLGGAIDQPTA